MKILVTGGLGFIGANLCPMLVSKRHNVTVLDNLRYNAVGISELDGVKVVVGDICDKVVVRDIVQDCDSIIHLAALPMVLCRKYPTTAMTVNVGGTMSVLDAVHTLGAGVRQIILASAVNPVLGAWADIEDVVDESYEPKPTTVYGQAKLLMETIATRYTMLNARFSELCLTILRFTNVYGPHGRFKDNPIQKLLALDDATSTALSPKQYARDYVHISDTCQAIMLALESRRGGLFHIGSGVETGTETIREIINEVKGNKTTPGGTVYEAGKPRSTISIDKARRILGYRPEFGIREGIQETWGRTKSVS